MDIPVSFPPVAPTAKTMPESHLPSHSITLETFLATKIMRLTEWENYTLVHKKVLVLYVKVIFGADCNALLTSNSKQVKRGFTNYQPKKLLIVKQGFTNYLPRG